MRPLKSLVPILALAADIGTGRGATPAFDPTHAQFDRVLRAHVRAGAVDYAALRAAPGPLNEYLAALATVTEADFRRWPEPERLAFLLNLYNAATLKLVVDHYPVSSIKDIGGFLRGPWKLEVVRVFGRVTTLDHVEHVLIRQRYPEPRIHFALVCAAKGCPPLRSEAYVGARLEEQLADQAKRFLAESAKNRIVATENTVYLSPLFRWYGSDFENKHGSVLAALKPYWPADPPSGYESFKVRYSDYDWSLNGLGE